MLPHAARSWLSIFPRQSSKGIIHGVNVILLNARNQILLGRRINSINAGTWGMPCGHIEPNETPEDAAIREAYEETSLLLTNTSLLTTVTGRFHEEKRPFHSSFVRGYYEHGAPTLCEPNKCDGWHWFNIDCLPSPLFTPIHTLLQIHPRFFQDLVLSPVSSNHCNP